VAFPSDRTHKATTVVIPVNDTSEFREIFEANHYGDVEVNLHANRPRLKFEVTNQLHALAILLPGKPPSSI